MVAAKPSFSFWPLVRRLPRVYWPLWGGTLVNRLGRFVLPFLAIVLGERHYAARQVGAVMALYGAGSMLAGPLGGWLADRRGRRLTMLMGMVGSSVSLLVFPHLESLLAMTAGAFSMGLLGDLARPAVAAAVADVVSDDDRYAAYSLLYWSINIAFAISPVLGGLLANSHPNWLFVGDAVATLVFAVIVYAAVPETRPSTAMNPPAPSVAGHAAVAQTPHWRILAFVLFVASVSLVFMQSAGALPWVMRGQGLAPETYGMLIAINGVIVSIGQPLATGFMARSPMLPLMCGGALLIGAGYGAQALAETPWMWGLCIAVWSLGEIAFAPTASAYVATLATRDTQGRYQGAHQFAWGLAHIAAPLVGMAVLASWRAAYLWLGCGISVCASAVLYWLFEARQQR